MQLVAGALGLRCAGCWGRGEGHGAESGPTRPHAQALPAIMAFPLPTLTVNTQLNKRLFNLCFKRRDQ